jgi:hypothetical protein
VPARSIAKGPAGGGNVGPSGIVAQSERPIDLGVCWGRRDNPGGPAMHLFLDADAAYARWAARHPDGYVVAVRARGAAQRA